MRKSPVFVCRLDVQSVNDMEKLQAIRDAVSILNKTASLSKRVVVRGRKPFVKMPNPGGYFYRSSKGPVGFDRGGNIMGGIANASMLDVYIYDRRD
jgi:hypothetical protein